MKRFAVLGVPLACVLALAGCGATHTTTRTVRLTPGPAVTQPAANGCPAGRSFMGCSQVPSTNPKLSLSPPPAGPRFPDVSSFQGRPDWTAAKRSIAGAVAKLGEGESIIDPSAAYNVEQFKKLGIPFAVYWFVRPDSCAAEGAEIEHAAATVGGVSLIVLDEEVPGLSGSNIPGGGYASCLNPYVQHATGRPAVVYRSSGNDFDASAPQLKCWVAAYGPSSPPACSGRTRVAWQLTDGRFGFPLFIPGVGQGDVSIDEGFLALAHPRPKVDPRHWGWLPDTRRAFGKVHARERASIRNWDRASCRRPVRRASCATWQAHMRLEERRLAFVAHHTGRHLHHRAKHPRWDAIHYRAKDGHKTTLGGAYRQLHRRTTRHGHVTTW